MISSDDILKETSSIKVLAFMEVEPLTDTFQQIVLTEAQARAMRDALFRILNPDVLEDSETMFSVVTNEKVEVRLPDVLDAYDEAFIEAHKVEE